MSRGWPESPKTSSELVLTSSGFYMGPLDPGSPLFFFLVVLLSLSIALHAN